MNRTAAIIGCGQIGSGWAARFLLAGWHVRVCDPDPGTEVRLARVITAAKASLPGLYDTPLPAPGRLSLHDSVAGAAVGASWVQESAPDDLALKREIHRNAQAVCGQDGIVASSTAALPLAALREGAAAPDRIMVAHGRDPVYLLPLVELLIGSEAEQMRLRAEAILQEIGMTPVVTGGHTPVSAGLQETVEREAAACIAAGAASVAQVDALMLYGPGLLWAQGGLSGTAVAGRDAALVGILRALKAEARGAGAALAATDTARIPEPGAESAPLLTAARVVPPDWADYNGHMTEARYLHAFGNATDRFMELVGVDAAYLASGGSFFTAETHIRHLAEMEIGSGFEIRTTCLAGASKRMHLWHEMRCGGRLVATGEHMLIHVSLGTRRPAPPGEPVAGNLARIAQAHARLARAEGIGRAIGDPR